MIKNDLERLRQEYADRERRLAESDIYSHFNLSNLFIIQQRQRATLALLRSLGYARLSEQSILEMGCGGGGVLIEYLSYGAAWKSLYGLDLLPDRLKEANSKLPHLSLTCADGQNLPYSTDTFDLEMQYTAFSSILDERVKIKMASEMLRVLKPGGLILWYDFWLNPTNPQTRGIRPAEIRRLFPECQYIFRKITLAPPLVRRIVPLSWGLAYILETLKIFNSHYLAAICPISK
jgi:ubiquinone/menaquinone biosynthesis C-methylase UbiE